MFCITPTLSSYFLLDKRSAISSDRPVREIVVFTPPNTCIQKPCTADSYHCGVRGRCKCGSPVPVKHPMTFLGARKLKQKVRQGIRTSGH